MQLHVAQMETPIELPIVPAVLAAHSPLLFEPPKYDSKVMVCITN